jgi:LPS-assembly protein
VKAFVNILCHALLLCVVAASVKAQTPELSADSPISFSEETGLLIASDNAVYTDENTTVEADEIRYNREEERIEAHGNVRVTRQGIRLLADTVIYNAADRSFSAKNFRAGYPPLFIEGESFVGDLDAIDFSNVQVYIREPVDHAPRLFFSEGTWVSDTAISGRGVRIDAFGGLNLPLPDLSYGFGQAALDVEASLGYEDNLGVYAQSSVLYPFSQRLALGGNLDLYSERGILIGPAAEWNSANDRLKAWFNSGWIHDHSFEERALDVLNQPIDQDRGFVDTGLALRSEDAALQFRAQATLLSDSEVLRDFRENTYFYKFQPDTYADFTWQQNDFLLNAFARSRLNEGYTVVERLPELNLEWLPRELGETQTYFQARLAATRYRAYEAFIPGIALPQSPLGTGLMMASMPAGTTFTDQLLDFQNRFSASTTLTRPMHFRNGLSLVFRAGSLWRHFAWEDGAASNETWHGELGLDLSHTLARTYSVDWPRLGIDEVHHQSRLSIQHRWHPMEGTPASSDPIGYDTAHYRSLAPVLDLANLDFLDHLDDRHLIRLGWENRLRVREGGGNWEDSLRLALYQDIHLDAPASDEWEALYTEVDFSPAPWLSFLWRHKILPEQQDTEASYFRTTLRSADLWSVTLEAEYLAAAIEHYSVSGFYRLTENLGLLGEFQLDARSNEWNRQVIGLSRRFANVWQLEVYASIAEDDRRQDNASVGMRLRWLSF